MATVDGITIEQLEGAMSMMQSAKSAAKRAQGHTKLQALLREGVDERLSASQFRMCRMLDVASAPDQVEEEAGPLTKMWSNIVAAALTSLSLEVKANGRSRQRNGKTSFAQAFVRRFREVVASADVPRCNLLAAARRLFAEVVKLASAREELPDWAVVPLWCALFPALRRAATHETLNPDVFVVMADLLLRETRAGRSDASPAAASLARVVLAWSRRRPLPPRVAVDVLRAVSEHSRGALHPEAAGAESTSSVGASASGVASAPGAVASALLRAAAAALSAAGPLSLPLARTCTAHTVEYALLLADPGSLSRVRASTHLPLLQFVTAYAALVEAHDRGGTGGADVGASASGAAAAGEGATAPHAGPLPLYPRHGQLVARLGSTEAAAAFLDDADAGAGRAGVLLLPLWRASATLPLALGADAPTPQARAGPRVVDVLMRGACSEADHFGGPAYQQDVCAAACERLRPRVETCAYLRALVALLALAPDGISRTWSQCLAALTGRDQEPAQGDATDAGDGHGGGSGTENGTGSWGTHSLPLLQAAAEERGDSGVQPRLAAARRRCRAAQLALAIQIRRLGRGSTMDGEAGATELLHLLRTTPSALGDGYATSALAWTAALACSLAVGLRDTLYARRDLACDLVGAAARWTLFAWHAARRGTASVARTVRGATAAAHCGELATLLLSSVLEAAPAAAVLASAAPLRAAAGVLYAHCRRGGGRHRLADTVACFERLSAALRVEGWSPSVGSGTATELEAPELEEDEEGDRLFTRCAPLAGSGAGNAATEGWSVPTYPGPGRGSGGPEATGASSWTQNSADSAALTERAEAVVEDAEARAKELGGAVWASSVLAVHSLMAHRLLRARPEDLLPATAPPTLAALPGIVWRACVDAETASAALGRQPTRICDGAGGTGRPGQGHCAAAAALGVALRLRLSGRPGSADAAVDRAQAHPASVLTALRLVRNLFPPEEVRRQAAGRAVPCLLLSSSGAALACAALAGWGVLRRQGAGVGPGPGATSPLEGALAEAAPSALAIVTLATQALRRSPADGVSRAAPVLCRLACSARVTLQALGHARDPPQGEAMPALRDALRALQGVLVSGAVRAIQQAWLNGDMLPATAVLPGYTPPSAGGPRHKRPRTERGRDGGEARKRRRGGAPSGDQSGDDVPWEAEDSRGGEGRDTTLTAAVEAAMTAPAREQPTAASADGVVTLEGQRLGPDARGPFVAHLESRGAGGDDSLASMQFTPECRRATAAARVLALAIDPSNPGVAVDCLAEAAKGALLPGAPALCHLALSLRLAVPSARAVLRATDAVFDTLKDLFTPVQAAGPVSAGLTDAMCSLALVRGLVCAESRDRPPESHRGMQPALRAAAELIPAAVDVASEGGPAACLDAGQCCAEWMQLLEGAGEFADRSTLAKAAAEPVANSIALASDSRLLFHAGRAASGHSFGARLAPAARECRLASRPSDTRPPPRLPRIAVALRLVPALPTMAALFPKREVMARHILSHLGGCSDALDAVEPSSAGAGPERELWQCVTLHLRDCLRDLQLACHTELAACASGEPWERDAALEAATSCVGSLPGSGPGAMRTRTPLRHMLFHAPDVWAHLVAGHGRRWGDAETASATLELPLALRLGVEPCADIEQGLLTALVTRGLLAGRGVADARRILSSRPSLSYLVQHRRARAALLGASATAGAVAAVRSAGGAASPHASGDSGAAATPVEGAAAGITQCRGLLPAGGGGGGGGGARSGWKRTSSAAVLALLHGAMEAVVAAQLGDDAVDAEARATADAAAAALSREFRSSKEALLLAAQPADCAQYLGAVAQGAVHWRRRAAAVSLLHWLVHTLGHAAALRSGTLSCVADTLLDLARRAGAAVTAVADEALQLRRDGRRRAWGTTERGSAVTRLCTHAAQAKDRVVVEGLAALCGGREVLHLASRRAVGRATARRAVACAVHLQELVAGSVEALGAQADAGALTRMLSLAPRLHCASTVLAIVGLVAKWIATGFRSHLRSGSTSGRPEAGAVAAAAASGDREDQAVRHTAERVEAAGASLLAGLGSLPCAGFAGVVQSLPAAHAGCVPWVARATSGRSQQVPSLAAEAAWCLYALADGGHCPGSSAALPAAALDAAARDPAANCSTAVASGHAQGAHLPACCAVSSLVARLRSGRGADLRLQIGVRSALVMGLTAACGAGAAPALLRGLCAEALSLVAPATPQVAVPTLHADDSAQYVSVRVADVLQARGEEQWEATCSLVSAFDTWAPARLCGTGRLGACTAVMASLCAHAKCGDAATSALVRRALAEVVTSDVGATAATAWLRGTAERRHQGREDARKLADAFQDGAVYGPGALLAVICAQREWPRTEEWLALATRQVRTASTSEARAGLRANYAEAVDGSELWPHNWTCVASEPMEGALNATYDPLWAAAAAAAGGPPSWEVTDPSSPLAQECAERCRSSTATAEAAVAACGASRAWAQGLSGSTWLGIRGRLLHPGTSTGEDATAWWRNALLACAELCGCGSGAVHAAAAAAVQTVRGVGCSSWLAHADLATLLACAARVDAASGGATESWRLLVESVKDTPAEVGVWARVLSLSKAALHWAAKGDLGEASALQSGPSLGVWRKGAESLTEDTRAASGWLLSGPARESLRCGRSQAPRQPLPPPFDTVSCQRMACKCLDCGLAVEAASFAELAFDAVPSVAEAVLPSHTMLGAGRDQPAVGDRGATPSAAAGAKVIGCGDGRGWGWEPGALLAPRPEQEGVGRELIGTWGKAAVHAGLQLVGATGGERIEECGDAAEGLALLGAWTTSQASTSSGGGARGIPSAETGPGDGAATALSHAGQRSGAELVTEARGDWIGALSAYEGRDWAQWSSPLAAGAPVAPGLVLVAQAGADALALWSRPDAPGNEGVVRRVIGADGLSRAWWAAVEAGGWAIEADGGRIPSAFETLCALDAGPASAPAAIHSAVAAGVRCSRAGAPAVAASLLRHCAVQATWSSGLRGGAGPIGLEGAVAHAAAQGLMGRAATGVASGDEQQGGAAPLRCPALVLPVAQANACGLAHSGARPGAVAGAAMRKVAALARAKEWGGAIRAADSAVAGLDARQGGLDTAWGRFMGRIRMAAATVGVRVAEGSSGERVPPPAVGALREATAALACAALSGSGSGGNAAPPMAEGVWEALTGRVRGTGAAPATSATTQQERESALRRAVDLAGLGTGPGTTPSREWLAAVGERATAAASELLSLRGRMRLELGESLGFGGALGLEEAREKLLEPACEDLRQAGGGQQARALVVLARAYDQLVASMRARMASSEYGIVEKTAAERRRQLAEARAAQEQATRTEDRNEIRRFALRTERELGVLVAQLIPEERVRQAEHRALSCFLEALAVGAGPGGILSPEDVLHCAARFVSLWLAGLGGAGGAEAGQWSTQAADVVKGAIHQLPLGVLVGFAPQLVSRLTAGEAEPVVDAGGRRVLRQLVQALATCHPHHLVPLLLAQADLRDTEQGATEGDAWMAQVRGRGASEVLGTLTHGAAATRKVVEGSAALFGAYITLVGRGTRPRQTQVRKAHVNEFLQAVSAAEGVVVPPVRPPRVRADGRYDSVPRLARYRDAIGISQTGNSRPRILTAEDSAGRVHRELAKPDDTRPDAVMEQLFRTVNALLRHAGRGRRRELGIRTYTVVPVAARVGVLEMVEHSVSIGSYLVSGGACAHTRYRPRDWDNYRCFQTMKQVLRDGPAQRRVAFERVCSSFQPVLRYFFAENWPSAAEVAARRAAYTRSAAVAGVVGHVVGLGDRHTQNILLDRNTAEVVHIDFGVVFEQGNHLPSPERVPFRLTRDVVDGFGPAGSGGEFSASARITLDLLRKRAAIVEAILEVLVHDPLYLWMLTPKVMRVRRQQEAVEDTGLAAAGSVNDAAAPSAAGNVPVGALESRGASTGAASRSDRQEGEAGSALTAMKALARVRQKLRVRAAPRCHRSRVSDACINTRGWRTSRATLWACRGKSHTLFAAPRTSAR